MQYIFYASFSGKLAKETRSQRKGRDKADKGRKIPELLQKKKEKGSLTV